MLKFPEMAEHYTLRLDFRNSLRRVDSTSRKEKPQIRTPPYGLKLRLLSSAAVTGVIKLPVPYFYFKSRREIYEPVIVVY